LLSLLERYDDGQDIKDAVLSYCNRGAVSSHAEHRQQRGPEAMKGFMQPTATDYHQEQQTSASTDQSDLD
jgi:methyltransferase-like protein